MVVFDTIYHPENTMMLKLARERGCKTVTGVDMFLRQAALQFKLYTGQDAPVDVMRDVLHRKLTPAPRRMTADPTRPSAPVRGLALIGYRGTGKSTVGRILAERLDRPFVDCRPRDRGPLGPFDPRDLRRVGRAGLPRLGGADPGRADGGASRRSSWPPAAGPCSARPTADGSATSASSSG